MAKVNIIMSVFNQENYIEESIESILNQTFTDFLLIIINDGSTDNSKQKIERFLNNDRIFYADNETNKGLIYSLNRGLEISLKQECQYIARMDSDDISMPQRLALQVDYLDKNPDIGILGSGMVFFTDNVNNKKLYAPKDHKRIVSTFFCYNPIFHPTVMIRKNVINEKRYSLNFPKYEDYALWIELINVCKFHNLKDILLRYRRHDTNVTNTYKDDKIVDQILFKNLLIHLDAQLNIAFSDTELELLSLISTASRAQINGNVSLDEFIEMINTLLNRIDDDLLDRAYLKQLLIERVILYLKVNNRKKDVLVFIKQFKAINKAVAIVRSIITARRWV